MQKNSYVAPEEPTVLHLPTSHTLSHSLRSLIPVILQSLQELALPVSSSAGQLGQTRGADLNRRSGAGGTLGKHHK